MSILCINVLITTLRTNLTNSEQQGESESVPVVRVNTGGRDFHVMLLVDSKDFSSFSESTIFRNGDLFDAASRFFLPQSDPCHDTLCAHSTVPVVYCWLCRAAWWTHGT